MAVASKKQDEPITIKRIERPIIQLEVKGTAPLIMNKWSEKAKRQMLDSMQGRKNPKAPKDPEAEFAASIYRLEDDTIGFPAVAFKSAMVSAGRFFKDVKMVELRQSLHVIGEGDDQLVRLTVDEPTMREDTVRVGNGGTDLRYRAQFNDWTATILVQYVPTLINEESVVAIADAAGMVGVGEWRPEKNGTFGTFELVAE